MNSKNTLDQWIDGKSDFPEDTDGRETFEKIKLYSAQLEAPTFNKVTVFENIKKAKTLKSESSSKSYGFILKIAAILVLAFGVLAFFHQMSWQTTQTAFAQTKTIVLPDESQVLLQPGSELSYNSLTWFLTREVELEGEAFFEVKKGETFSVKTDVGQVKVLGTKFNVKSTAQKLNVVCYEGRVKVSQNKTTEIIGANEFVVMKDNAIINKNKIVMNKLPTETSYFHIIDEEFDELVEDVERYYDVKINIENIDEAQHFSGKLPKNNIEKALEIISKTYQLQYNTINKNNYIFVVDGNN